MTAPQEPQPGSASTVRMFARALRRRCPRCGLGNVFTGWTTMAPECPDCGLDFEHEEGYWTGAMLVNLVVTLAVFLAVFIGFMVLTWPDVPWGPLLVLVIAANVITPIVFYPVSKTLFIAGDLAFRKIDRPDGGLR